jgi:hypothetical protein
VRTRHRRNCSEVHIGRIGGGGDWSFPLDCRVPNASARRKLNASRTAVSSWRAEANANSYKRGSAGSDTMASTPKTHCCTWVSVPMLHESVQRFLMAA